MTIATLVRPEQSVSLADMRDRLHFQQMVSNPTLTLDRMRGHLAKSDGTRVQEDTAAAIRLADKSFWLIQHEKEAARRDGKRAAGRARR